jgi:hypothetical protein
MENKASRTLGQHWGQLLLVGLVAGMAYGMMEMVIEAVIGHGFWSPLRYIAAVFTLGRDTDPSFAAIPVVVGLMGHMMNSLIFGLIFALLIAPRISGSAGLIVAGMVYAAAIFFVMWLVVVPLIDPAMGLVNPVGFFFSHALYGLVLGAGLVLLRQRLPAAQPAHV